jgi:hypothetical protein
MRELRKMVNRLPCRVGNGVRSTPILRFKNPPKESCGCNDTSSSLWVIRAEQHETSSKHPNAATHTTHELFPLVYGLVSPPFAGLTVDVPLHEAFVSENMPTWTHQQLQRQQRQQRQRTEAALASYEVANKQATPSPSAWFSPNCAPRTNCVFALQLRGHTGLTDKNNHTLRPPQSRVSTHDEHNTHETHTTKQTRFRLSRSTRPPFYRLSGPL